MPTVPLVQPRRPIFGRIFPLHGNCSDAGKTSLGALAVDHSTVAPAPLGTPLPAPYQNRTAWARAAASALFVAVTLVGLSISHDVLKRFYWDAGSWLIYLPLGGAIVLAGLFARTRYNAFNDMMGACMRASAVGLTVLILFEWPDFTLADPATAARGAQYVSVGAFIALAMSLLSWLRPAFILPVAVYLLSARLLVFPISGVPMSSLDIQYMLDMALYLVVLGFAVTKLGANIHPWLGKPERQNEVLGVVFGLHLANYFWSGYAKLVAGPTPWYWALENKTYNQIPYTIESGILPLGHIPWLSDIAYQGFQIGYVPLNVIIVAAQLFAIVCILRIGWLKVASVMYELLHVGIYVLGGLFFWPWVWNNVTIWWSARRAKQGLAWNTKLACLITIVLGAPALKLNEAAFLAWFDVADARQVYIEAVTEDGREVKVPSAWFNSHSYSMSHGWIGAASLEGHYEHTPLASTTSLERNEKDGQCVHPETLHRPPAESDAEREERHGRLERFLTAHHNKMIAREKALGFPTHYFHGHHHPSNPFLYDEFNELSLDDVVGYQQVIESVCHRMARGKVEKTVHARSTEYVSVR